MDFYPDFFNIGGNLEGNLSALGLLEEDMELCVREMVDELKGYGLCVPTELVTRKLEEYEIPYEMLPKYMKDMIDELDCY